MLNIEAYLEKLIPQLHAKFGDRLVYVGLQGSYLRGEATDNSDIDIMAVIDNLNIADLSAYRNIIEGMEAFDRSCGFICSKEDLKNWNPLEIWNLLNSTKDYFGTLRELIPAYTEQDIRNFIKLSINNTYHMICHSYIHAGRSALIASLPGIYKGVFFILQNLFGLRTGEFISTKSELLQRLDGKDRTVLQRCIDLSNNSDYAFEETFELLFTWCQETLASL